MSNVFEQSPLHPLKQNSDDVKKMSENWRVDSWRVGAEKLAAMDFYNIEISFRQRHSTYIPCRALNCALQYDLPCLFLLPVLLYLWPSNQRLSTLSSTPTQHTVRNVLYCW